MSSDTSDKKHKLFDEWMKGDHVFVNVNTKAPGVELPDSLLVRPSVNLKLSYLFQGETTSDENGVVSYLKFDGTYCRCVIPWSAIWGMTNDVSENRLWQDEMPKEVIVELYTTKFKELAAGLFGKKGVDEEQLADESSAAAPLSEEKPKKRGHLKLIK